MNKYVPSADARKIVRSINSTLETIPNLWKKHGMSKGEIAFWSDIDHKLSDVRLKIRRTYKV